MDDMVKKAKTILGDAEHRVQELACRAVSEGAYVDAVRMAEIARSLCELAQSVDSNGMLEDPRSASTARGLTTEAIGSDRHHLSSMPQTPQSGGRRARKGDYPRFFRRRDDLIKIGWSKKEKSEYQHKAPRRVIDALAHAITRHAGNGRLFTVDELLPLKDPQDGSELPSYQVYVALAWFRSAGLVQQHGRSGYSAGDASQLEGRVPSSWARLASHLVD